MYEDHTVAVVIPTYNEAGFVGTVIETIPDYVDRIYPVDDCSTDGSWEEIQTAAARIDGTAPGDHEARGTEEASGDDEARGDRETPGDGETRPEDDPSMSADGGTRTTVAAGADAVQADDSPRTNGTAPGNSGESPASTGAAAPLDRRVVPIRHEQNRGVGGAIKTGYQRARADRIDVTVVMGGDGQMDPDWMPDLLEPVVDGRAEYAKANRLLLDEHHETMPRHRFVGNHILTMLTKIATGYWSVGDPQHGYTAISLSALDDAGIDEMYEFFGYCNDLLIRLSAANCRVADVPCPLTYADEESHIAYSSYIPRVSGMLLRSFLRRLRTDRGSSGGRGRLALFVGGAIATVGGVLGVTASGIAAGRSDDSRNARRSSNASQEKTTNDESASADTDAAASVDTDVATFAESDTGASAANDAATSPEIEPAAADARDDEPAGSGGSSSVARWAVLAIAGVAALLGAMLLDAVMNSNYNYTERIPDGSGPRTEESE